MLPEPVVHEAAFAFRGLQVWVVAARSQYEVGSQWVDVEQVWPSWSGVRQVLLTQARPVLHETDELQASPACPVDSGTAHEEVLWVGSHHKPDAQ